MFTEGKGGVTLTVAVELFVPPGPVTVIVYIVVLVGDIFIDPFKATSPIPLSILTSVALVEVHVKVADSPS